MGGACLDDLWALSPQARPSPVPGDHIPVKSQAAGASDFRSTQEPGTGLPQPRLPRLHNVVVTAGPLGQGYCEN